ncbi:hypothetical protein CPB86DRAFT_836076 [Serendipita vermifera]|nr:hypothetical protein CPB86DRAFT_836076 [Serendipita vermifera]
MPSGSKYLRPGILLSVCWVVTLLILSCIRLSWRPKECTTVESVSGFYGPGTYLAWILTTLSAMLNTMATCQNEAISLDLLGSSLYVLASMADFQLRVCLECKHQSDFQAKASLQVMAVSNLLCLLALSLGEWWHDGSRLAISSDQWQLWKAYLLAPYVQDMSRLLWLARNTISVIVPMCIIWPGLMVWMWFYNGRDAFWRVVRGGNICDIRGSGWTSIGLAAVPTCIWRKTIGHGSSPHTRDDRFNYNGPMESLDWHFMVGESNKGEIQRGF